MRRKDPHPIWRGIGCFLMLIIPVLSWGISAIFIEMAPNLGIQLPVGLLGPVYMPQILFKVPGLVQVLYKIESINNLYGILLGTFTFTIILGGVMALVYAFIYRFAGPPRYTDLDVPPPNIKTKRYKR